MGHARRKSQSEKSKMNIFKLFSCFLHAHNIVKFRLHTDIIQFFDEYVTGRADFIRKNELNREAAELDKHQTEEKHHKELTNHKKEYLNLTNQYLHSKVTFWTKKQDRPISRYHESWLTNYKTRH